MNLQLFDFTRNYTDFICLKLVLFDFVLTLSNRAVGLAYMDGDDFSRVTRLGRYGDRALSRRSSHPAQPHPPPCKGGGT